MRPKTFSLIMASAVLAMLCLTTNGALADSPKGKIVHDAEYYILDAQNGKKWAAEDKEVDKKLAELRKKFGRPPNIIHIMWDDTAFGDVGIPAIQKVRGLVTPHLNTMAEEGILFTRMYTEVGCTPSRAAVVTGRLAVRSGMYNIGMLLESHGMRGEEVTIAEVLSKAGYATAFHGKWHLGDIEESYPHNQGFDEAFFTGYNQILSLNTRIAEGANASMGLYEDMLPADPYKLGRYIHHQRMGADCRGHKRRQDAPMGRQQPRELYEDRPRSPAAHAGVHRAKRKGRQALLCRQLAELDKLHSQPEKSLDIAKYIAGRPAGKYRSLRGQGYG